MPRLIWVFAGHTVTLLVLSCRGSFVDNQSNYIIVYININEWHIFLFNIWLCHIFSTYQIQPMYSLSPREKTKGLAKISFPTKHFSSCAYHGPIIGNTGNFHDISFFNLVSKYRNNFFCGLPFSISDFYHSIQGQKTGHTQASGEHFQFAEATQKWVGLIYVSRNMSFFFF